MSDVTPEPETEGGLFSSYLENVPEEHRDAVTGYLKDAEKNVNTRLAEAAEIQKTLGGYREVEALSSYPPEQLSQLLAWHQQVTASEDSFKEWLTNAAREANLTPAEAEDLEDAEASGELTRDEVQKLIEERSAAQIAPLQKQLQEWQEKETVNSIETEIRDEFARLESEHKVTLNEDQKAMIIDLGLNHEGDGWVQAGFDRFNEIGAERAQAFVSEADGRPKATVASGGTEAFKPTTDWGEASKQARARLEAV